MKKMRVEYDSVSFIEISRMKVISTFSREKTYSFIMRDFDFRSVRRALWKAHEEEAIRDMLNQDKFQRKRPLSFQDVMNLFYKRRDRYLIGNTLKNALDF